jgi:hypothetical protein
MVVRKPAFIYIPIKLRQISTEFQKRPREKEYRTKNLYCLLHEVRQLCLRPHLLMGQLITQQKLRKIASLSFIINNEILA